MKNFFQKKLWLVWRKLGFLRLLPERRVRLEVTTDGRHLTFLLTALGEAGYGVHGVGSPFILRELMCLRKSVPMPFVIGGKERECGISISDKSGFDHREHREHGGLKKIFLDYDYFSGLTTKDTKGHEKKADLTEAGLRLASQAGAAFSNPSTSELARACENTSPTRYASGPAGALGAHGDRRAKDGDWYGGCEGGNQLTDSKEVLEGQSQAGLQVDNQNNLDIRLASGPAGALGAHGDRRAKDGDWYGGCEGGNQLTDSKEVLEDQSQAGLQVDNQNNQTIRKANDPSASEENSSSVKFDSLDPSRLALRADLRSLHLTPAPALDCGQISSSPITSNPLLATAPEALRAPYFMHPSVYHRGLHKRDCASNSPLATSNPLQRQRRFRLGFFGTHDREFYSKYYHFPGMNRYETLEVFLQKFGGRTTRLQGDPSASKPCEIAVSIDHKGGDRRGKAFLSQEHYFEALRECDFVLSPPGWCMPVSHNLIEAMFCGAIPITNAGAFMAETLHDGVNGLEFRDEEGLVGLLERALAMDAGKVEKMRRAVLDYYNRFLAPRAFAEDLRQSDHGRVFLNAEENSIRLAFPGMVFPWDLQS